MTTNRELERHRPKVLKNSQPPCSVLQDTPQSASNSSPCIWNAVEARFNVPCNIDSYQASPPLKDFTVFSTNPRTLDSFQTFGSKLTTDGKQGETGFLVVDFAISMVIVTSITMFFLILSWTLGVVEITQYVLFSSTRSYMAAHQDQSYQEGLAQRKFAELTQDNRELRSALNGEWVSIRNFRVGNFNTEYSAQSEAMAFTGTQVDLEADGLAQNLPFLGSTQGSEDFKAKMGAYLTREPTAMECYNNFVVPRFEAILRLDNRYSQAISSSARGYVPIADSGC